MNGSPPAGPAWQYFTQQYQKVWGTSQPVTLSQNTYDSVIIACLAMTAAKSSDPTVWNNYVKKVAEGNGEAVTTYKDGVAALKAGKTINFNGASGTDDYNEFHNVAGSWDVVQWDSTGTTLNTVFTVSEQQIASWSV
jgi:ABC-type branched-subunit amino acid transport system substrate-binding protein